MADIKVSVIVPVYNGEKYIEQCIHSITGQTLKEIEVIIINDGSTDNSKTIIENCAARYGNIRFIDSANKGVSAARNAGINMAGGEFIGFVDVDDWIEPDMYATLYSAARNVDADFAICNVNVNREGQPAEKRLLLVPGVIDFTTCRPAEIYRFMRFKYDNANWNKMYKTAIIRQQSIAFDEKIAIGEDLLFNLCYLQFSQRGIIVDEALYNYRVHPSSVMSTGKKDIIHEYNLLYSGFSGFANSNHLRKELIAFKSGLSRNYYYHIIPMLAAGIRKQHPSFLQFFRLLKQELKRTNPGIFFFEKADLKGIQGIKKNLLKNKQFSIFSLLVTLSLFFKKG